MARRVRGQLSSVTGRPQGRNVM
uniref:Uncharacterized protein n=1 Tax=Rhizophora mucronata TaxID=61149 RepID=A0A2P2P562_RHIMU